MPTIKFLMKTSFKLKYSASYIQNNAVSKRFVILKVIPVIHVANQIFRAKWFCESDGGLLYL